LASAANWHASEMLRESLRLMERRESLEAAKLNYL
jgi:hypothetical protein